MCAPDTSDAFQHEILRRDSTCFIETANIHATGEWDSEGFGAEDGYPKGEKRYHSINKGEGSYQTWIEKQETH